MGVCYFGCVTATIFSVCDTGGGCSLMHCCYSGSNGQGYVVR